MPLLPRLMPPAAAPPRITDERVAQLQTRVAGLTHELCLAKSERDQLAEQLRRRDKTALLLAYEELERVVELRVCGVGSAEQERRALARVREMRNGGGEQ